MAHIRLQPISGRRVCPPHPYLSDPSRPHLQYPDTYANIALLNGRSLASPMSAQRTSTFNRPTSPSRMPKQPITYSCHTLRAYRVWILYPSDCLVSPAMTVKSAPAIARMVPPLSEYGLNRLTRKLYWLYAVQSGWTKRDSLLFNGGLDGGCQGSCLEQSHDGCMLGSMERRLIVVD